MEMQRIIRALPATLRRHKLIRALAFLDPSSCIQLVQFNDGARAFVDVREGDLRTVMIAGSFDPDYFRIARAFLPDAGICFDVGANAGLCTFGLVPSRPRASYHLFEANPQLWPLLRRSASVHPEVSFRVVEAAVGERQGSVQLEVNNPDHDIGQAFISAGAGVETKMITLDDYIRDAGVPRIDFLKMDVEGYECFVLEGARAAVSAGKLPVVLFEIKTSLVARHGRSLADVLTAFRSAGYALYHVRADPSAIAAGARPLEIAGLSVKPVEESPTALATDLLAVHESAPHLAARPA